jgi:hypothetical protein
MSEYYESLRVMSTKIEQLKPVNHISILRIIVKDNNEELINENRNGIHINLSELSHHTISNIQKYLDYIFLQEQHLNKMQAKQEDIKSAFCSLNP